MQKETFSSSDDEGSITVNTVKSRVEKRTLEAGETISGPLSVNADCSQFVTTGSEKACPKLDRLPHTFNQKPFECLHAFISTLCRNRGHKNMKEPCVIMIKQTKDARNPRRNNDNNFVDNGTP